MSYCRELTPLKRDEKNKMRLTGVMYSRSGRHPDIYYREIYLPLFSDKRLELDL